MTPDTLAVVVLFSGEQVLVDPEDLAMLSKYKWYLHSNGCAFTHYSIKQNKKYRTINIRMHRLIMNAPKGLEVDHINGNELDNRKDNLRLCTHIQNNWNKSSPSDTQSGYRGVTWHQNNKQWRARIRVYTKEVLLGYYRSAEDASAAYESARMYLHGEYLWQPIH